MIYAAAPGTASHVWHYRSVRAVGAGRAAVFTSLTPFAVIALPWLTRGEPIGWYHLAGASIVIAGVALAARRGEGDAQSVSLVLPSVSTSIESGTYPTLMVFMNASWEAKASLASGSFLAHLNHMGIA